MKQKNGVAMYWKTSIRMGKAGKILKGKDWEKLEETGDFSCLSLYKNRNDVRKRQRS
jgi:hypothetical protein